MSEASPGVRPDRDDCKKRIQLSTVNFSVVPKLVQQAPALLGAPSGKVTLVQLSPGVFCRGHGWLVYVENAGMVEFRLDGKVGKVQKIFQRLPLLRRDAHADVPIALEETA